MFVAISARFVVKPTTALRTTKASKCCYSGSSSRYQFQHQHDSSLGRGSTFKADGLLRWHTTTATLTTAASRTTTRTTICRKPLLQNLKAATEKSNTFRFKSTSSKVWQQKSHTNSLTPPSRRPLLGGGGTIRANLGLLRNNNSKLNCYYSFAYYYKKTAVVASKQLGAVTYFSSQSPPPRPPGNNRISQGVGLLGAASVLFGKTKYVLAALKLTKFASLGSMILTVGTYSMFFGWPYAVGMVGLIAVHEAGHAWVMHQKGIPFSPAVFIPFMGAVIATKQLPRDAWEDAAIGYGGPALGSLGAGVVAVGAHMTDSQLLYALADFGFMINLFNLLPIGSMDGGRISGAISPYVGVAGLGMGGVLAYQGVIGNPIFYLVLLSGGYETFMRFYDPANHIPPGYYNVTLTQRATVTVGYFGLIAALVAAMDANQRYRKSPEVLIKERELEKSWDMR